MKIPETIPYLFHFFFDILGYVCVGISLIPNGEIPGVGKEGKLFETSTDYGTRVICISVPWVVDISIAFSGEGDARGVIG